jgi:hypothetical protein
VYISLIFVYLQMLIIANVQPKSFILDLNHVYHV